MKPAVFTFASPNGKVISELLENPEEVIAFKVDYNLPSELSLIGLIESEEFISAEIKLKSGVLTIAPPNYGK